MTFVFCIWLSLTAGKSFGQEIVRTGANNNGVQNGATENNLTIWAVPAEQKIRPDDQIETKNLIWSKEKNIIKVAGAGNEHVPFQIVITDPLPAGRNPRPAAGFFIKASDLVSKQGKRIPENQINFYLEHFIMLTGKSGVTGATGYWPDALAPLKVPFSMAAQYNVIQNRPIWVDISIPSSATPAIYSGTIMLTQNDKIISTLNVELEIYNFSLPEKTHLISYMNISKSSLANFYNKSDTSEEIDRLTQKYYDFLYAHRMEPWFNDQLQPKISFNGGKVEVKFDDARYRYYLNTLKSNRVLLESYPSDLKKQMNAAPFSAAFNQQVKSYLSMVAGYFEKHGWKDKLVFNSPVDEPNTKEDYEQTRQWANLVNEAAPGVPFLATESPVSDNPDWGTLRGYVNDFSIHGNALNDQQVKQAISDEQQKGGEMTWYISCDQAYPQPNYFIDAPALDPVMVPWITARYNMAGILYWALNFWSQTPNPWLNANTFVSGFECSNGYILNGEGSLLYPGNYVNTFTGEPNVDGPVSSIRFELLREGIEDYEYLWMLKDSGDQKFADSLVKNMVIDVSAFSRNRDDLYSTRRAIARRLEALK
jgi:hypothetical protein